MGLIDQPTQFIEGRREHELDEAAKLLIHYLRQAGLEVQIDSYSEIRGACEHIAMAAEIGVELRRRKLAEGS